MRSAIRNMVTAGTRDFLSGFHRLTWRFSAAGRRYQPRARGWAER